MHGSATPLSASAASAWLLVLLCAVSGAYCLLRARRADRRARGMAAGEAVMGLGMAAMAVPSGTGPWGPQVLLAVCCGAAVHALWLLRGGVHHAHHLVGTLAMAYMALSMTAGGGHVHGRAGLPVVTGVLLLYYAGYVLLGGARLVTSGGVLSVTAGDGGAGAGAAGAGGAGELVRACRLAMGTGMLAMLLTM
ncbi:uncharacterized protein DUF5134 [Streptomyces sp. Ag109_G2-6]|uniref:DUF5134 domain-containing protein n=1 Tax=Streptomyces TaxID=1883 RepID=UPI0009A48451|nr:MULTISPECIES: DUF5134 domain-containing protein [Streptomyces]RPF29333.1 uncharacterized protein DUF5134 [Streptomyces sp. Ag109_G2-6]